MLDKSMTLTRAQGLKFGSVPVPTSCEDEHVKHIRSLFLEKGKKLTRRLTVKIMDEVFEQKTTGKKFKTDYILFALCCFLCPMTKDEAGPKLFPCVMDLHAIPNYAWPQFVLDWLERIRKEENLELLDPTLSQFPQPCLRHPVEQIKKMDDILMEALENKTSRYHESTSDVKNKPSGEQTESDLSDGRSESDESDGGEEDDPSHEGEEGDPNDGGEENEGNEMCRKGFQTQGCGTYVSFP
ncbi:hypothetical protein RHSIM_Rhsim12G0073400 [Rhododendron simsii]|uniref:Uncharacterized protein n=1 Tax=Rhododendron simsii TaxID=118357 RepID=A0A834G8S7_RHOSS|nr:hypothetical protein RHSIM_Rhsim12G0073400 [Rhododendron simsii]